MVSSLLSFSHICSLVLFRLSSANLLSLQYFLTPILNFVSILRHFILLYIFFLPISLHHFLISLILTLFYSFTFLFLSLLHHPYIGIILFISFCLFFYLQYYPPCFSPPPSLPCSASVSSPLLDICRAQQNACGCLTHNPLVWRLVSVHHHPKSMFNYAATPSPPPQFLFSLSLLICPLPSPLSSPTPSLQIFTDGEKSN